MLQQKEISKGVYAAFKDSPFALPSAITEVYVAAGSSIQEIIDKSVKEEWQKRYLRVILNDEVVQPDNYKLTFVKESDVVGMVLVPQGSEFGQILKAVAVIAIVIAATALMPEGAPLWATMAVGAASGLAASLALNALFPPPVPGVQSSSTSGTAEDPVYGFSRTGNQINRYAPIPRIYGCRKVFPQHAIAPYIIAKGTDQYLYQAFTAGYGPLKIEDIRIGDNPIGNYKDVEYFVHEGFVAGDELKIVKHDNWQDPYSIKLVHGVDSTVTTTDDAEEASLAIQFSQGLFQLNSQTGDRQSASVILDVQARQVGASSWSPLSAFNATLDDATLNSSTTSDSWNPVGDTYAENPRYAVVSELPPSSTVPNSEYRTLCILNTIGTDSEFGSAITTTSYQDYQNSYAVATSTSQIKVEKSSSRPFFVNVNLVFPTAGRYEIKVQRVTDDRENESLNPHYDICFISSLRSSKNIAPVASEKPVSLIELKIRATDQLNGAVNNLSCVVTSKLPVWDGSTWSVQETRSPAWAYLDVMRGSAAKTVVPDGRIDLNSFKDWSDWCAETQPNFDFVPPSTPDTSTNSGFITSLYYSILHRLPDADGLAFWVSKLDANEATRDQVESYFMQSAEASVINRACCDLEITSQTTSWEVLKLIAATGYATPSQNGGKYSISIDREQETPVQVFTPKNIRSFSGNMTYHIQPHALRISYTKTKETEADEIIVYDDGYNADGSGGKAQATIFETMKLVGISRYKQAYTIGRRALAQGILRIEKFTISCDVENLLASRGSLVLLAHDVPMIGSGTGRVIAVSGSSVTIDENFKLTSGSVYAHVRHLDGTVSSGTLSGISGATASLSGASASEGDLVVYGALNRVMTECLVKSVRPGQDLTATLELVPYAPGIYTADTEEIPDRDPFGGSWTGGNGGGTKNGNKTTPGQVTSLKASSDVTYDNKTPMVTVNLSWGTPVTGGTTVSYKIYFQESGAWRLLGSTTDLTYKAFDDYKFLDSNGVPINMVGKALVFAVSAVGTDASSIPPESAAHVSVTPITKIIGGASTLTAVGGVFENILSWTYSTDGFDVAYAELWGGKSNNRGAATLIAKVAAPAKTFHHVGLTPGETWFYWIRLLDGKGNYSEWYPVSATSGVACTPSTDPTVILTQLNGAVDTTQLAEELNQRIDLIDADTTNPNSVASRILAEAQARGAAITQEATTRQAADSSLSSQITTLTASVNANAAAIQSEATTRANADSAEATARTTLAARVSTAENNITANSAAISSEATARANGDSANATSISTVAARLDSGDFAAVKVQSSANADSITGLNAKYSVQVDANGGVAGIMLNSSGVGTSSFIVSADAFKVYKPGYTAMPVFQVGSVNGSSAVGINGNLVVDGTIVTQSINGNAVTVASAFSGYGDTNVGNSQVSVITGTLTISGYQPVLVSLSSFVGGIYNGVSNAGAVDVAAYVSIGGSTLTIIPSLTSYPGILMCSSGSALFTGLSAGTHNISIKYVCNTSGKGFIVRSPTINVLETKR